MRLYVKDLGGVPIIKDIALKTDIILGSAIASFSAHKNGTDQTGVADSTWTKVTFGTEVYDVGSYFASSKWTPPPKPVQLCTGLEITGTITAGQLVAIGIYKNGVIFKQGRWRSGTNDASGFISIQDVPNGTDYYEVFVFAQIAASTGTVDGTSTTTWFMGCVI